MKRTLKSQGTCKINGICTAYLKVTQRITGPGDVCVQYCSSHCGHEVTEIQHLRISETVKLDAASKLMQGVSIEKILDDIRDNGMNVYRAERDLMLNRQDLRNIVNQYNIHGIERHCNDHLSVVAWIAELETSPSYNPVLLFKQQGESHDVLDEDNFLLCLQTEFQRDVMKSFAGKVICIDATHSTNSYDFLLITVLVLDEFGEGVPVAWAISDKEDEKSPTVFFNSLKKIGPISPPTYFMSDDAHQYWNAWKSVFGENASKKLLCRWHVDRAWRKSLQMHIPVQEERACVYQLLQVLLLEHEISKFLGLLQKFLSYLMTHHSNFCCYFKEYYAKRPTQWATCYRIGTIVNTNMHVESFHRLLKVCYMKGKQNRRVDHLINILLKIARDKSFERLEKVHKGKFSHRTREMTKRHNSAC